jgi:hypothetical protein
VSDARVVANFLLEQDVRPVPCESDVAAFLERSDTALFYALCGGRIVGTAGCVRDGWVMRLTHFAVSEAKQNLLAAELVGQLEGVARAGGTSMLAAQALHNSPAHRLLLECGFAADWEECDVAEDRVVTVVDLLKPL